MLASSELGPAGVAVRGPSAATANLSVFTTASVGGSPFEEAYDSGTHELYITNDNGSTVTVLSDPGLAVVATIPVGLGPYGIAYDPAKAELFVSSYSQSAVVVIADSNNTIVDSVSLGSLPAPAAGPAGLVYDSGTDELYVAAWVSGVVVAYNVAQPLPNPAAEITVDSHPDALAYDPQTNEISVTCHNAPGSVYVISDSSHQVVTHLATGDNPIGIAYDPGGGLLVVANAGSSNVTVVDATRHAVVQTVNLLYMGTPAGVAYDPTTGALFVSDPTLGAVSVLLSSDFLTYVVTGIASGTPWSIFFSGTSNAGYTIANDEFLLQQLVGQFAFPPGSYTFDVSSIAGYQAVPTHGSFTLPTSAALQIDFEREYLVNFVESGIPAGTNWSVNLSGTVIRSTSTTIQFVEVNGTYPFTVTGPAGLTANVSAGTIVVAGANVTQSIAFRTVYTVTFTEVGLPAGTTWSVALASEARNSSGTTITFSEPVGSYPYTVGSLSGYNASPSVGTVHVTGSAAGQTITFTATTNPNPPSGSSSSNGLFGLPGSQGIILLVAVAAIVAAGAAFALLRRRPGRPSAPASSNPAPPPAVSESTAPGTPPPASP